MYAGKTYKSIFEIVFWRIVNNSGKSVDGGIYFNGSCLLFRLSLYGFTRPVQRMKKAYVDRMKRSNSTKRLLLFSLSFFCGYLFLLGRIYRFIVGWYQLYNSKIFLLVWYDHNLAFILKNLPMWLTLWFGRNFFF